MTEESKKEEASVGELQEERTVSDFERNFVILWNSRHVTEDELDFNQEVLPRGNEDMPNTYSTEQNMQNTIQGSSSQSFSMEGSVHQAAFTQGEVCSSATEATPDINIRGRDDESSQPVHISGQKSGENGSKKMLEKKSDVHRGVTSGYDSMQGDMNINDSSAGDSAQKMLHGTVSAKETYVKSELHFDVLQRVWMSEKAADLKGFDSPTKPENTPSAQHKPAAGVDFPDNCDTDKTPVSLHLSTSKFEDLDGSGKFMANISSSSTSADFGISSQSHSTASPVKQMTVSTKEACQSSQHSERTYSTERNMQNTIQGPCIQSFSMEGSVQGAALTQGEVCSSEKKSDVHRGVTSGYDSMQGDMNINDSSAGDSAQKMLHGTVSAKETYVKSELHFDVLQSKPKAPQSTKQKKSGVQSKNFTASTGSSLNGRSEPKARQFVKKKGRSSVQSKSFNKFKETETQLNSQSTLEKAHHVSNKRNDNMHSNPAYLRRLRFLWDECTAEVRSGQSSDMRDKVQSAMLKIRKAFIAYAGLDEITAFLKRLQAECFFHAHEVAILDKETKDGFRDMAMECILKSILLEPWSIESHHFLAKISHRWGILVNLYSFDDVNLQLVDSGEGPPFIDPKVSLCLLDTSDSKEDRITFYLKEYEIMGKNEITAVMYDFEKNKNTKKMLNSMNLIFSKFKLSRSLRALSFRIISECFLEESLEQAVDYAKRSAVLLDNKCVEGWYWVASLLSSSPLPEDGCNQVLDICSKGLSLTEVDNLSVWMVHLSDVISSNPRRSVSIHKYKEEFQRIQNLVLANMVHNRERIHVVEEQVPVAERDTAQDDSPSLEERQNLVLANMVHNREQIHVLEEQVPAAERDTAQDDSPSLEERQNLVLANMVHNREQIHVLEEQVPAAERDTAQDDSPSLEERQNLVLANMVHNREQIHVLEEQVPAAERDTAQDDSPSLEERQNLVLANMVHNREQIHVLEEQVPAAERDTAQDDSPVEEQVPADERDTAQDDSPSLEERQFRLSLASPLPMNPTEFNEFLASLGWA